MKIAYFVHDLTDPAVARRVRMLQAGGAEPLVLGFRREASAPDQIQGAPVVDLGRTYDARLGHRAAITALRTLDAARLGRHVADAQFVIARTLEMLAIASAARRQIHGPVRLVYECLDIHRLMLGAGMKSRALREIERRLMRGCDLLVVSSPAYLDAYFRPRQGVGRSLPLAHLLVENKVLELEPQPRPLSGPAPGPPWRISWLGAIRCRKSLCILTGLAARRPDLVEVRIHGRPAHSEFEDFDRQIAAAANVSFGGVYVAADLPALYRQAHFAWAIDYMEEGQNSDWLLPNRLYEASRYGAVPIALSGAETGRYLAGRGFGVRLSDPSELEAFLERLTPASYADLRKQLAGVPAECFVADARDCRRLVDQLAGRAPHSASAESALQVSHAARSKAWAPEHYPDGAV